MLSAIIACLPAPLLLDSSFHGGAAPSAAVKSVPYNFHLLVLVLTPGTTQNICFFFFCLFVCLLVFNI